MKPNGKEHQFPVIYKITNIQNGKIYVGSTKNFYKRYVSYKRYKREKVIDGIYIEYAIKKYGFDSFDFSILEKVDLISDLMSREQYWLDLLSPFDKIGYNECRIAYRMTGIKMSPETIEKMKKAQAKVAHIKRQKSSKPVLQIDKKTLEVIKEHESAKLAGKSIGKRGCRISAVCSGDKPSFCGFFWCLKSDYEIKGFTKPISKSKVRKVIQMSLNGDFIREWGSSRDVERELGFNNTLIRACCRNKFTQAYGFKWKDA